MMKDEIYDELLDVVQKNGGYIRIKDKSRPILQTLGEECVVVAAVFAVNVADAPLKVIDKDFYFYDLYDSFSALDIMTILETL